MVGYVKDDYGCAFSETIADIINESPTGFEFLNTRGEVAMLRPYRTEIYSQMDS